MRFRETLVTDICVLGKLWPRINVFLRNWSRINAFLGNLSRIHCFLQTLVVDKCVFGELLSRINAFLVKLITDKYVFGKLWSRMTNWRCNESTLQRVAHKTNRKRIEQKMQQTPTLYRLENTTNGKCNETKMQRVMPRIWNATNWSLRKSKYNDLNTQRARCTTNRNATNRTYNEHAIQEKMQSCRDTNWSELESPEFLVGKSCAMEANAKGKVGLRHHRKYRDD